MSHLTTTSGAALVTKIFAAFLINLTSRSSNFNFTCSIKTTGYLKSLSLQHPFLGYPPVKIHNLFTNRINNPLHCGSAKIHFLVTATLSLSCRSPPVSKRKAFWVADWLIGVEWALPPSSPVVQRRAGTGKHPGYCRNYPPPKKKKVNMFHNFSLEKRTPFEDELNQLKKKISIFRGYVNFHGGYHLFDYTQQKMQPEPEISWSSEFPNQCFPASYRSITGWGSSSIPAKDRPIFRGYSGFLWQFSQRLVDW